MSPKIKADLFESLDHWLFKSKLVILHRHFYTGLDAGLAVVATFVFIYRLSVKREKGMGIGNAYGNENTMFIGKAFSLTQNSFLNTQGNFHLKGYLHSLISPFID